MKSFKYLEAIAALVGTIMGAGILGLPYAIQKVGAIPGVILLAVLGLATLAVNLMFAEVILRTRTRHQLAGYANKYLGVEAYWVKMLAVLFGGIGALTIYIIGEGAVLSALFGQSEFIWSLVFFACVSPILLGGIKSVKRADLFLVLLFIAIITVIVVSGGSEISFSNYAKMDWQNVFVPYGAVLFSMSGLGAIVTLREVLRGDEKKIKSAVIAGTLIPLCIYIIFTLVVIGVLGEETTEVATIGLGQKIGPMLLAFGNLFALFAMTSGFLNNGLITMELLMYDLRYSRLVSWLVVCATPLLLFLIGSRSFVGTIGVVGSVTYGISAIYMIFMYWKAKKKGDRKPEFILPKFHYLGYALITLFALGFLYSLFSI